MKFSQMLIPTSKEIPADAEIVSHQLMIRAGLIRKLASGTYTYLPLGLRGLQKIMQIVRKEMNAAGAQEILAPSVQPMELWQKTGRSVDYGETLGSFKDRHGRWNVLAPTAEEVFTFHGAQEINSYKQLPINLYQISFKFRDEFRPRFGVLRSREFLMKDAYSFHATKKSLEETYRAMYDTYCHVFRRCGLDYVIVQAETGEMGGSGSDQFTIPCNAGEDVIVYTQDGDYAANIEKAAVDPVAKCVSTNSVPAAEKVHTPNVGSIKAVCEFLKTHPANMIKTLVYWEEDIELLDKFKKIWDKICNPAKDKAPTDTPNLDEAAKHLDTIGKLFEKGELPVSQEYKKTLESECQAFMELVPLAKQLAKKLACVLVRGDHEVNSEKLKGLFTNMPTLAPDFIVQILTQANVGFAGPLKLYAKTIKAFIIDHAVAAMPVAVTGANETDYHLKNVVPQRDFPLEGENILLADVRNAVEGDTYQGKPLLFKRGIEVGQVFKLGTKYSNKLGAKFLDEKGKEQVCLMGCYGIGINRIMASAIETHHDKNGIVWPISIAPFEVIITAIKPEDDQVAAESEKLYQQLQKQGIDVLLDDRPLRAGFKFKDADLIGIPIRITIGQRGLAEGNVEIKLRRDQDNKTVPVSQAADKIIEQVKTLYAELET